MVEQRLQVRQLPNQGGFPSIMSCVEKSLHCGVRASKGAVV